MEEPQGGLPKSTALADNENNFYLTVIYARIEFVKDTSGNVTEVIAHYIGKNKVYKKIR